LPLLARGVQRWLAMRPCAVLLVLACWCGAAHARDGRTIYNDNCAACHGADGRGGAAREASFPVQPPDFTDCRFTTPEPNSDWFASIHEGGPARGFDRRMPAFDQVLSEDDIVAVVGYLRHFCRDRSWPRGGFNLPRPFFVEKAFPEDEAIVRVDGSRSEVTTTVFYERRFGARWQLEVVVPVVNAEQMTGGWAGGIGDIAFAVKRVLVTGASTIVSGAVEVATPTGRFDRGFGAGTTMIEGSVMAAQLLPRHAFVQLQAGAAAAYDRSFPDEAFGRIALGDSVVPVRHGRLFAPMVEVIAARELASDAATEVDVVPELQVTLSARQHIRAAAGVQVPVTERSRDTIGLVYVLWDIADGGLLEGW
jgi:hypothetical protein